MKYVARTESVLGTYDQIDELRFFNKLTDDGKYRVLSGNDKFSVAFFDIEATHLKANIGRILCCTIQDINGPMQTLSCLDRRFKKPDVYDDSALAAAIIKKLESFDIIVGWNSKEFDVKFINARAMRGGHRAKLAQFHVDGMWSWRSKAAAWAGLANVQKLINPDAEVVKTSIEWQQWMRAIGWDSQLRQQAVDEIIDHCERDVLVLEEVYLQIASAGAIRSLRKDGGVM